MDATYEYVALTRQQARAVLLNNEDPGVLVMCRGYDGDDDNFTELVREDDWDLDFEDDVSYLEFELWIRTDWKRGTQDPNEAA